MEGSPAEEAGLKTNDIIVKINGEASKGQDLTILSNKIKGEEGTEVELEIQREGEKNFTKKITRRKVSIKNIDWEMLEGGIGYIQLMSFDGECSEEFKKAYEELKAQGAKSLIIDVRDNGGGLVSEVVKISDMILKKGETIMITTDKDGKSEETKAETGQLIDMNIVLLVNQNSASASEILAGALKDNKAATLVGETTFGKGIMQEIIQLESGGAMKITIEEFKTPNGDTIHKTGVKPDYEVENKTDKEDAQLQKAIDLLK